MTKPRGNFEKTNYKTRLCYWASKHDNTDPSCFTLANSCANYGFKCVDCMKIQGDWEHYKKKGE